MECIIDKKILLSVLENAPINKRSLEPMLVYKDDLNCSALKFVVNMNDSSTYEGIATVANAKLGNDFFAIDGKTVDDVIKALHAERKCAAVSMYYYKDRRSISLTMLKGEANSKYTFPVITSDSGIAKDYKSRIRKPFNRETLIDCGCRNWLTMWHDDMKTVDAYTKKSKKLLKTENRNMELWPSIRINERGQWETAVVSGSLGIVRCGNVVSGARNGEFKIGLSDMVLSELPKSDIPSQRLAFDENAMMIEIPLSDNSKIRYVISKTSRVIAYESIRLRHPDECLYIRNQIAPLEKILKRIMVVNPANAQLQIDTHAKLLRMAASNDKKGSCEDAIDIDYWDTFSINKWIAFHPFAMLQALEIMKVDDVDMTMTMEDGVTFFAPFSNDDVMIISAG